MTGGHFCPGAKGALECLGKDASPLGQGARSRAPVRGVQNDRPRWMLAGARAPASPHGYVKARMCAVAHQEASKEDAQEETSKDA
ncbi:MAG: hypothetical protein QOG21_1291 [Actinomycetota bacterium]|jgi:hypothetical protein|nr:hypothetical protein [Actinomycetota bacterium]